MAQIGNSLPTGCLGPAGRVRRLVVCEQNSLQVLWRWHQWCARSVHDAIHSCLQFTGFTTSSASLEEMSSGSCLDRRNGAEIKGLTHLQEVMQYLSERRL